VSEALNFIAQIKDTPTYEIHSCVIMQLSTLFSCLILLLPLQFYILPYLQRFRLRSIPGPFLAAFSNLWLMYQCRRGQRYRAVDDAHKKYGPVVRIQPNHVSINDPRAIPIIYGHGKFFMKRLDHLSLKINRRVQFSDF
jgi:hypothetical protein